MKDEGLYRLDDEPERWQGEYALAGYDSHVIFSSIPGIGDVNVKLIEGSVVYAKCKKGKNLQYLTPQIYALISDTIMDIM